MKRINFLIQLLIGLFAFSFMAMAQAAGPLWTFAPVDGYPSSLTISNTGTATVKYTVTNQTNKKRTLVMQPQVGVSQTQPCTVGPKGSTSSSCTLTLTISGSLIPPSGVSGGPGLCQANPNGTPNPNLCYQPSPANILNIKVTAEPSLVSIDVTPVNPAIAQGITQQFNATGIYSDNSTKDLTTSVIWSSSNTSIATISSSTGLAEGISQGTVTISATSGAIVGTTNLTVTTAKLKSIVVKPTNPQIAQGTTQQFIAEGIFTDGSIHNITSSVVWSSSNTTVALISNRLATNGLAAGRSAGSATITATLGGISGTTTLTVTNAVLQSIFVTPMNRTIAQGIKLQYIATGVFSDNSTQDLTNSVNWASSNTSIATISNTGEATGIAQGKVLIKATSGNVFGTTSLTVTAATLTSIAVTPANSSIAKGTTQQFIATGTFTDGSTSDITSSVLWSSSQPEFAPISNDVGSRGVATGESAGQTTITATLGTVSGNTPFTVTNATLTSISVSPANQTIANGVSLQYTATGIYSDNSIQDLTYSDTLIWSTSNAAVALISATGPNAGQATGTGPGVATITATYGTLSGTATLTVTAATLQSIAVTPTNATLPLATTQQFIATGTFSNGTTYDITSSVEWSSGNNDVLSFSNPVINGLATGETVGTTTVKATLGTVSSPNVNATVTNATLVSINVDPANAAIPQGLTQQFTATGVYSDGSTKPMTSAVSWSSSAPSVATISDDPETRGLATGVSASSTPATITATYTDVSSTVSGTANLTVTTATLRSIAVTPTSTTIITSTTQQFTAVGTFTNGTTYDITSSVTWTAANPAVASFDAQVKGLATGLTVGSTGITATLGAVVSNSANLEVIDAVLTSIVVTPANKSIVQGTTQEFTATGVYSNGRTANLTDLVNWDSSNPSVATINTSGVASAIAGGSATIRADLSGIVGSTTLSVTPATLVSIGVAPANQQIANGTTQQYKATGVYSNGSELDLTSAVSWTSGNNAVASISSHGGLATAKSAGSTTITATLGTISGFTPLTVSNATLASIEVAPANAVIATGLTQLYTATGVYSDGSTQPLTSSDGLTWSSNSSAVSISTEGLATGLTVTTTPATITATYTNGSGTTLGTAILSVSSATLKSITVTPSTASIAKGTTQQFIASGTFTDGTSSDITSSVVWSSDSGTVSISNTAGSKGLATGLSATTTAAHITATLNGLSSTASLTVTNAVLTSITVNPTTAVIADGTTQQFSATGVYSDLSTQPLTSSDGLTWSTSDPSIAAISTTTGLATGIDPGTATITATANNVSGTANLIVTNATLMSLAITPVNPRIVAGTAQQFIATGTYSDSNQYDLTSAVTWSSSNDAVASVSNQPGQKGLATSYTTTGTTAITATLNALSDSTNLNVEAGFTLSGSVSNLTIGSGYSVTLQNNGGDNLLLDANGSFTFPEKYLSGTSYNVTVLIQPTGQQCSVTNATGTFPQVTDVEVVCNALFARDSFTGASATLPWITLASSNDQACLTAGDNTGSIPACQANTEGAGTPDGLTPDQDGNGVLRLTTTDPTFQGSGIIESTPVPTSQGLSLEFQVFSYSDDIASGADGISFMIINADAGSPPSALGCVGAGLGYGRISHGYVGIGLDEYGNFSKEPVCSSGTPNNPNNIGIRGATTSDPNTSNPYILGNNPTISMWQRESLRTNVTALDYRITFTSAGVISVFLNGTPYLAGVNVVPGAGTPPEMLYFGFAASTGTHYNIHEIRNFAISIPTDTSLDVSLEATPNPLIAGGSNQYYTFTIRNTGGSSSSGTIQLFDNGLPAGITLAGPLTLGGPAASVGTPAIQGCNSSGSSIGSSCSITGATITSVSPNNYLTVTVPINVASPATDVTYSASIKGGGDLGCNSAVYSPYLCSGSIALNVN
ncbi:Ig-like domain-containing protein [Legionella sainthelensi]|uniref:BIG2 domain-containing protein n=1 Tax=Legionella sainthelensi TaxID=28087 RepID=A0A2H5FIY8_9GAMM|nr:Ig-like domain-containing protein [Legionella sainthelensi]AUH71510.1 hypothetical protein CAB17_05070 [Legionella sainthelensi]